MNVKFVIMYHGMHSSSQNNIIEPLVKGRLIGQNAANELQCVEF